MSKCSFKAAAAVAAGLLICACLFSAPVRADSAAGYTIGAYDVQMTVGADNTLDITERITADFSAPRHGIIRSIPVSGVGVSRVNGKTLYTPYHNGIQDVSVADSGTGKVVPYSQSREDGNVELKIGDADRLITGAKTYVIHYRCLIGASGRESPDYDVLYYNLIGTGWDTSIAGATFSVAMPAAFDADHLSLTAGSYGTPDASAVTYRVEGTTVTGRVTRTLAAGEGLTLRLQLPKGYFASRMPAGGTAMTVLVLLLGAGSLALFFCFGRDRHLYVPVEVSPPEDLNSAEAGYIIDGHADTKDVVSLLIYWADKGYLSISSGRKKKFTLHRLREPDGAMKPYEARMFRRLFRDGDDVKASQLRDSFYTTVTQTRNELAGSFLRSDRRLFTRAGNRARAACFALAGLAEGLAVGRAVSVYFFSLAGGAAAGSVVFVLTVLIAAWIGYLAEKGRAGSKAGMMGGLALDLIFLAVATAAAAAMGHEIRLDLAAAVSALVSAVAGAYAKKRTEQGARWLGSMMGLRRFIQLAEKKRLEAMVEEDPAVFYHILPYAYVLGVTDKWARQFESIAVPPPGWFSDETGSLFSAVYFCSLLDRNMTAFQTNMVSVPSQKTGFSGGNFSGGGGFTGGGMGGGGGSSW